MKSNTRSHNIAIVAFWMSLATSQLYLWQSAGAMQERHNFETRAELEAQVKAVEGKGNTAEAYRIHYRLDHGDFQEGDRIVIKVQGTGGFSDTLVVRGGRRLQLPQMAEMSLDGILRSELTSRLTAYVSKYLRDPVVQAKPLVRVGILGSVARPGYYYAAADLPISDVLMSAGGPTTDADVEKVSVRREGQVILDEANTRTALSEGMSMDMLSLQAGDEISVGQQRNFNWAVILPTATAILGLLLAYGQLHH
jgi:protein involved in polysaccharide export with SLBB domain